MTLLEEKVPAAHVLFESLIVCRNFLVCVCVCVCVCVPRSSVGKESVCNARDQVRFLSWKDPLKKEMAIHSSILAWKIPQTEELVWLQSMGSQESDGTY